MANRLLIIACGVFLLLVIGFLVYKYIQPETEIPEISSPLTIPEPEPVPEPSTTPEAPISKPDDEAVVAVEQEEPPFILPSLDNSDQLIREGAVNLTRHEGINRWLGPNDLIRKFVVFVDNIAEGRVARESVRVLTPEGSFTVRQVSEEVFILDEASYQRYNRIVEVIVSIDARRSAEFFMLLSPLFQNALQELGYPDRQFGDVVFKAIGRLLEAPIITKPVRLIRPVVMYEFEDPRLESLSPAQKQLVRMGPENTRMLQDHLRNIALELRLIMR